MNDLNVTHHVLVVLSETFAYSMKGERGEPGPKGVFPQSHKVI